WTIPIVTTRILMSFGVETTFSWCRKRANRAPWISIDAWTFQPSGFESGLYYGANSLIPQYGNRTRLGGCSPREPNQMRAPARCFFSTLIHSTENGNSTALIRSPPILEITVAPAEYFKPAIAGSGLARVAALHTVTAFL